MVLPNTDCNTPNHMVNYVNNAEPSPVPQQEIQRPERPEAPSPVFTSSLKFLMIRRRRVHKISRELLHVHTNGLRKREPTCPANATCVGIDDIGEYMYNQAIRCSHLREEANRLRNPNLPPITDKTPAAEFITDEAGDAKLNLVVEIGPAQDEVKKQNCWDSPPGSDHQ